MARNKARLAAKWLDCYCLIAITIGWTLQAEFRSPIGFVSLRAD